MRELFQLTPCFYSYLLFEGATCKYFADSCGWFLKLFNSPLCL